MGETATQENSGTFVFIEATGGRGLGVDSGAPQPHLGCIFATSFKAQLGFSQTAWL